MKRIVLLFICAVTSLLVAKAQIPSTANLVADGEVNASVYDASTQKTYVAGDFTAFGNPSSANFASLNAAGINNANALPAINGQVNKIVADGANLFVVGIFHRVGNNLKIGIVKLNAQRQVDPTFNPALDFFDTVNYKSNYYEINDIAISGNLIAISGKFRINGTLRNVALLNKTTGAIYSWSPFISAGTDRIYDVEFSGSLLFVGGQFNLYSGANNSGTLLRRAFAAFVVSNPNAVTLSSGFNFGLTTGYGWPPIVYTMSITGSTLYIGGFFSGGSNFYAGNIFSVNISTGTRNASFNANLYAPSSSTYMSSYVSSIVALSANQIFVGGQFYTPTVGGNTRYNFALLSSSGGFNFSPPLNIGDYSQTRISNISIVNTGTNTFRIFLSGPFNYLLNSSRKYNGMVAYDFNSVNLTFSQNTQITNGTAGPILTCIRDVSGNYYLGGSFSFAGGTRCPNLAVFNSSGNLDMTATNSFFMNSFGNMSIKSMALLGSNIYLGGSFKTTNSSVQTSGRNHLMRISKTTLATDLTFPQLDATYGNAVNALVSDGASLYIGGSFSKYLLSNNSQITKANFFAWNTSFNSAINYTGNINGIVKDIAFNSSSVFVAGSFPAPLTGSSPAIAKFSKSTASLQSFVTSNLHRSITALKVIGSDLYVGEKAAIYVYNTSSNAFRAQYNLPIPTYANYLSVTSILPVTSSLFVAGFNSEKLYFNQIHTGSTFQSYSMNEDTRVSAGFRPLNYFSNLNLIFGTYWSALGLVTKGSVASSGNGARTFAVFNNNLVLPAPPAPGLSASSINLNPSTTSVTMTFTPGNGARRIVLARKDLNPIIPTTFPTSIFASSSFGSGTNLGSATFCVYDGMGSNVIISNLQHLSNYRFAVVEYNINGTVRTYRTTGVPFASCFTLDYAAPTIASTFLQVSNITSNSFNQSWINGSGSARMVLIKEGANSISFVPTQGINYFTNQTLSDGSRVASLYQSGNFFNFTGLNPGTTYSVAIIDYNTYSNVGPRYGSVIPKTNVSTSAFATLPNTQASSINIVPGTTSANISWTRGSGGRSVAIITKVPNAPLIGTNSILAVNGNNYSGTPDLALSPSNSQLFYINGGNQVAQVVYHDNGNSVTVNNLNPGSTYQVAVFESNGGGFGGAGQVVYLTSQRPTSTFITNALVTAPSSITNLHSIISSQDDARLNWSGGNATNSLLILKKDGPVNFAPTNDNFYSPNPNFGLGAQLGVGNYAVYAGNSNSFVNIANLDPDAEYHFAVYDYNAQGLVAKYNPTPYRGIFRTSRAWPVRAGGPRKDAGGGVVTDASGNVYVAGTFETFGSWGTRSLPSSGGNDIFLTKYSPNGKPLWVVKQGGGDADAASSLALDNSGNLIMTGSFRGTGTFGTGNTFGSNGIDDIFISKLDPSGNVIWSKRAGGTDQDVAFSIATDNNGDIYIAGYFRGTITFPGSATTMTSLGGTDALIAKYDGNGNLLWAKSGGGTGNDFAYGVSVRGSNVAMVGQFESSATFNSSNLLSAGQSDIFIAEYSSSNGSLNWVNKFGGTGNDIGFSITTAGSDYVIAGQFSNSVTIGSTTLNSAGNSDVLVVRVNSSGTPVWFKRAGGISQDAGRGIAINSLGDKLFVTGSFAESAVFGPTTLNSFGNLDIFVTTVDLATGDFETTYQNGGPLDDEARGITAGTSNTSFITGYFNGQGSFGNVDLTSAGDWDIFVHKFTLVVAPDLNNGLVAWYKMNNNANDASGNGNNGFAQNITSTNDRSNSANKAYLFQPSISGVDVLGVDPVNVAGAATTNASTYLAWIKTAPNFENSNTPKPIFYTSFGDSEIRGIQLSDINTVTYAFNSNTTSLQVNQNSVAPIQDNSWHHLAVVFKSGIEIIFYLDGNEIGRQNITNFFEPETFLGTHWNIGHVTDINRNTQIYSFNGSIDDVRIYRRALTSSEVNFIKGQSATNSLVEESEKKLAKVSPEVKMWPNPTNGKLNLDLGVMASKLSLKIVDLSGVEVMNRTISNLNDSYVALDVQQLNVGYYFVQLNIDGQSSIQKLIISK
jgi:hypothetical protein